MKTYKANVYWQATAEVTVKAETPEDAKAVINDMPLPDGYYVGDSFEIENLEEIPNA